MAISGDKVIARKYLNPATGKMVEIELTVRDHLFFHLLQKLEGAIRTNG